MWDLASSLSITTSAGTNCNATAIGSETIVAQFYNEAEAEVCVAGRYDFADNSSTLQIRGYNLISECISSIGARKIIAYDLSNFPSRSEAEDRMNVLNFESEKALKLITEDKSRKFIISGETGVS